VSRPPGPVVAGARQGRTTADRLWDLLGRASRGELASLDEFARLLAAARLRSHFVPERIAEAVPTPPGSSVVPWAVGVLVTALLVGAAVLFWRPWEQGTPVAQNGGGPAAPTAPQTTGTGRQPAPPGPGADWLAQALTASPDELTKLLEQKLGAGVSAEERQKNLQAFLGHWKERLEKLLADDRDPDKHADAQKGLVRLYQEMGARQRVAGTPLTPEEQRWRDYLELYLGQSGQLH